mgnify:FL=1|tara:strand:- start:1421 stop:2206 length:786 start_codon:yes stop_codon:yes gene_type:complete
MRGYIKIGRGLLSHPALQKKDRSFCEIGAFVWILLEASFADRKYRIQNQEIVLKRGQLCCSIGYMAKAFNWNRSKVQRFLDRLKENHTITTNTPSNTPADTPNIITITHYDDYQDMPNDTSSDMKHNKLTNKGKEYIDEFNDLWNQLRAKKGSKKKAQDKYLKIRNKVKRSDLIEKYNELCDKTKDFTYIPHFITWLNGERYLDKDEIKSKPIPKTPDQYFRERFNNIPKGYVMVGSSWNEIEYSNGKDKITFSIKDGEKI